MKCHVSGVNGSVSKFGITEDDRRKMRKLRAAGVRTGDIAKQFNVSRKAVDYAIYLHKKRRYRTRVNLKREDVLEIPREVLAEREFRLSLSPRDLSAAIFGDPPPGYSALERRA